MSRRPVVREFEGYDENGKTAVVSPPAGFQLRIYSVSAHNGNAGGNDTGLLVKRSNAHWDLGQIVDASAPDYTDQTAVIQAGSSVDVFSTTNNDGFLVGSPRKFDLIGLTSTQADGGGATYEYTYYNGTAYVDLSTYMVGTPNFATTGDKLVVFKSPQDWAAGSTAAVGGPGSSNGDGYYNIRVRATTAGATAVQANDAWTGKFINFQANLAQNGILSLDFPENSPIVLESEEAIMPYFATASALNHVAVTYGTQ